ncbi:MAG: hypothetical protein MJ248_06110, partial [Bacilli bacterium]|nr:hypothetical protein [Bacilli bacterium]
KEIDRFAQIADCEDVVLGKHKPLPLIKPIEYEHFELDESDLFDIKIPAFNEEEAYKDYLNKKEELKKHYHPFLSEQYSKLEKTREIIRLTDFDFRRETEEDKKDFSLVLMHKGEWEKVTLPHYVGPDGKYNVYYYGKINVGEIDNNKEYILKFEASDYITDVYLNGRMVVTHEGFFAPFQVDLTPNLLSGENTLVVVLHNEHTTTGNSLFGTLQFGKKIYAATHFGYDEPVKGWHHCPAGVGIYGNLTLEITNKQRIEELYIRPNFDKSSVSGTIQVINAVERHVKDTYLVVSIEGRNFKKNVVTQKINKYSSLQYNENFIPFEFEIKNFKPWTNDEPYLYELIIKLFDKDGNLLDVNHEHFGMRKFISDEKSKPYKGQFYFNNERIILNGTNEMGFLPLDVMRENDDQLLDDIMAAKVANLNMFRMTQRPVLRKVYDYFDMLGMFCQTDFPLFSFITPEAFGESFKQVSEMEKLVRNHPSCIIDSFCNECIDGDERGASNYVLSREDAEKTFETYRQIVKILNPDKVIKIHEGDINPLKTCKGLSDFHTYCYWYISQGIYGGWFERGYLLGVRKDWMTGCGEYGVDGLDRYELMKKYAPKEWLPKDINEPWVPNKIARAQCWPQLSDFVPEQDYILDWIRVSRQYQREAIVKYVYNLRRRIDMVQYRAVHLLIDAWPMGWTKTLIDVDRIPKPAYYAFADANIPFRVNAKANRYTYYANEPIKVELFALNDLAKPQKGKVYVSFYEGNKLMKTFVKDVEALPVNANYSGDAIYKPTKGYVGEVSVRAMLVSEDGNKTFDEIKFVTKPRKKVVKEKPVFLGNSFKEIKLLFGNKVNKNVIFTDDKYYKKHKDELEQEAYNGKRVVLFFKDSITVLSDRLGLWRHPNPGMTKSNNWLERNPNNKFTKEFELMDFKDFYNQKDDMIDITARYKFYWSDAEPILFARHDRGNPKYQFHKEPKFVCASKKHGEGEIIATTLENINSFANYNPVYDKFIRNLLTK